MAIPGAMHQRHQAMAGAEEDRFRAAINLMALFINQVTDYQATGVLSPEQTAALTEKAEISRDKPRRA